MSLQPEPSHSSEHAGPADPEHDPRASYALDPAYARALTKRVVSTSGETVPCVLADQRAAARDDPAVERGRRARGVLARAARAAGLGAHLDRAPFGGAAAAARPRDRASGRDHRPDLLGVGQGAQARLRRAAAHRPDRSLLRADGARPPRHRAQAGRRARPHPRRGQPRAQGRGRDHLAVELPLHDGAVRRPARPARRQRGGHQAGRPDDALGAAGCPAARGGRLPARACGTWSPVPAASSVRR